MSQPPTSLRSLLDWQDKELAQLRAENEKLREQIKLEQTTLKSWVKAHGVLQEALLARLEG